MTFSILATDGAGAFGIAVASSSPAVAARCVHLRAGVGGAASQNITDPRLGTQLLDLIETGADAQSALSTITAATQDIDYRQLSTLDSTRRTAAFSGRHTLGTHADAAGTGAVCAGNLLADAGVPSAMLKSFGESDGELEVRLLAALAAGLSAGGEAGPVHSAGLATVRSVPWRDTDLRVDWVDEDPIGQLSSLVERWLPQRDDYVARGLSPAGAPSYGVPGDD
jgi:uncharacterized Ntn-hydrolase superfamily protein